MRPKFRFSSPILRPGRACDPKSPFLSLFCAWAVTLTQNPRFSAQIAPGARAGPQTPQSAHFRVCSGPKFPTFSPKSRGAGPDPFWGGFSWFFSFSRFGRFFLFLRKLFPVFSGFAFSPLDPKRPKKKQKAPVVAPPGPPGAGFDPPRCCCCWPGALSRQRPSYHDREPHIVMEPPPSISPPRLGDLEIQREKDEPRIPTGTLYRDRRLCIAIRTHYRDGRPPSFIHRR